MELIMLFFLVYKAAKKEALTSPCPIHVFLIF